MATLINLGFYLSLAGFLAATIISATATDRFGKSTLGAVFTYMFIGTGILLVSSIFKKLGGRFFDITDSSQDIWYHVMFFMAVFSYHYGFKAFVGLGSGAIDGTKGWEKRWGIFSLVLILSVFFFSGFAEPVLSLFKSQPMAGYGFMNFFSFAFAAIIGTHFLGVKNNMGKIGQAIAKPLFVALWALALGHLYALLSLNYGVFPAESVEQVVDGISVLIASICVVAAAMRLKAVSMT